MNETASHHHAAAHGHAPHDHGLGHVHVAPNQLRTAFFLSLVILLIEAVGGWWGHSLALLSDAGHMLTDAGALALAWYASHWAQRQATRRFTYGFFRAGILAALANAVTLVLISGWIFFEAVRRFAHPQAPSGPLMWIVALMGLTANLLIAWRLSGDSDNLNVRSAWLHVLGDAAASAAVVLGGIVITYTGWAWVDPLLSVGIAGLVFWGTWRVLCTAVHILMEGTPQGLEPKEIAAALTSLPHVSGVHDLHVWSLDAERRALTCHLVVSEPSRAREVLHNAGDLLLERFGIVHSTLQVEDPDHRHGTGLLCSWH